MKSIDGVVKIMDLNHVNHPDKMLKFVRLINNNKGRTSVIMMVEKITASHCK